VTTKIGLSGSEATVANPEVQSYQPREDFIGSSARALDGTLRTQIVALKRKWSVTWAAQEGVALSGLLTELRRLATLSWYPPEGGGPYAVQASNLRLKYMSGNVLRADVSCDLEQV